MNIDNRPRRTDFKKMDYHTLASQYRKPSGTLGKTMGRVFGSKNKKQNDWVVSLLKIKPTDYVLEIGFGSGQTIKDITRLAPKGLIAGIDFSKVMVQEAVKRNAKAIKAGLVKLQFGDASSLPYPNNYFDKIFAIYVIYFWRNPIKVLKKIHKVLKPKGRVAIYLSSKKTLLKIPFTQTGLFNSYTRKELVIMFRKAGFKNIKCNTKNFKSGDGICVTGNK